MKFAAINKENCEEHPRSNLARNSNVPRSQEDYITQFFEEIVGRVTKKLCQEFTRKENCILGALSLLDDFLMNPMIQGYSTTTPRHPGTNFVQAREPRRTTARLILLPKRALLRVRQHKSLAHRRCMTWWQEFTKKSQTVPPAHPQETRRKTVLPVNRTSAVKTPLRWSKQTKFS